MMTTKSRTLGLAACLCLMLGGVAFAQDKPAERYTYVTYSVCDLAQQGRADEIFEQVQKGVYEAAVADGTISNYGWLKHHTGGKWRRVVYSSADSMQSLLDAQKKLGDQMDAKNEKLGIEFSKICNSHDDYIWRTVAGNIGTVARGGAAFSVYLICDQGREDQADALMTQVFAPMYDKMVADGKLKSWGWNEHIVGGQYRRLETFSAADVPALMAARAAIIEAYDDNPLGDTLTDICGDHTDYMWEITSQSP
ncbi:MAG TPA: hypothetical protein VGA24_02175 [Steroidobacteraceae bacterium]